MKVKNENNNYIQKVETIFKLKKKIKCFLKKKTFLYWTPSLMYFFQMINTINLDLVLYSK